MDRIFINVSSFPCKRLKSNDRCMNMLGNSFLLYKTYFFLQCCNFALLKEIAFIMCLENLT